MNVRYKNIAVKLGSAVVSVLLLGGVAGAQTSPAGESATTRPASPATGTSRLVADGVDSNGQINLLVNKSVVITTTQPYARVNVAQPDVADVNAVGGSSILLTAKKPGSTQLIIWDDKDNTQVADINVTLDVNSLQGELTRMFPSSEIEVAGMNGAIALRGKVKDLQTAEQAVQIATPYAPKVMNFLEVAGGQQVVLQVRFAEVSRTAIQQLGVNFAVSDGIFSFGSNIGSPNAFNPTTPLGSITRSLPSSATMFGSGAVGNTAFEYFISALRENNLLRTLAEPNLVATSGQEAEFLAGGEFPIPVPQTGAGGGSTITIEYREFGVRLKFVPVVLGDGKIRLKVSPEVSDLDFTAAVSIGGTEVPGLRKRNLTTTVEMYEGQTFAVAGLLNQTVTAQKSITPLLGDIPVVGALFRSVRYQRAETELVVLVTPRIASAMNPDEVGPIPGETWRHPSEAELMIKGDLGGPVTESSEDSEQATAAARPAPRYQGQYGFSPEAAEDTSTASISESE